MKCQSLFSRKNIINLLSAEIAPRMIRVNDITLVGHFVSSPREREKISLRKWENLPQKGENGAEELVEEEREK